MYAHMEKGQLFNRWLLDHAEGNNFLLFANRSPLFELTQGAKEYFATLEKKGEYLYILCTKSGVNTYIPLYIGKTTSPRNRWLQNHLPKLRNAVHSPKKGSYSIWVQTIAEIKHPIHLICIHENSIKYPPIPDFPLTVGSIEYQLISLANDAFPGQLLNFEGVAR